MYKLEYLPAAKQAMIEIITYISKELKSPTVALLPEIVLRIFHMQIRLTHRLDRWAMNIENYLYIMI